MFEAFAPSVEKIVIITELFVLFVLIWHARALNRNYLESGKLIKEIHMSHKKLHKDTAIIKKAIDELEKAYKPSKK